MLPAGVPAANSLVYVSATTPAGRFIACVAEVPVLPAASVELTRIWYVVPAARPVSSSLWSLTRAVSLIS